jgi:signal transduction histidine kinase
MGLALTRRIALLHGGRIALENRPGGGARATLWIPCGKSVTIGNDRGKDARA